MQIIAVDDSLDIAVIALPDDFKKIGLELYKNIPIKEIIDPNVSTIIQHSVEIDSGNSGGPLLIKNDKHESGYTVVGVNTWKSFYRQNTNYAIPSNVH